MPIPEESTPDPQFPPAAMDISVRRDGAFDKRLIVLSLILFGTVLGVFWPSVHGAFLFYDESAYVQLNPHVNTGLSWDNVLWAFHSAEYANWHPVTWISHMLDCQLFGLNPWGHHLTNIIIHALNTVLIFVVFRRMTSALWPSLAVALLFGLHPLRVASATYISERRDVLSLFFWMLTLWAYARFVGADAPKKRRIFYGVALLFFILGLMSKTMVVTLPFVLLLLDFWPLNRWELKRVWPLVREKIPFFILTIVVCWIAYGAQHHAGMMREMADLPLSDRIGNASVSYFRYLGKLFWPADLCIYYPHPGRWPFAQVLLAHAGVVVVSIGVWFMRRRIPYLFTGWFWFVGTLVPVIGLVQLLSQSIADRYTYIPMIGALLMLVWGLNGLAMRWKVAAAALPGLLALALAFFAIRTRAEIEYYKDDLTLWTRATAVTKNNFHAHYALGMILELSEPDQAIREFEESVRINPTFVDAQNDLAVLLARQQRFGEAIEHFRVILQMEPTNQNALFNGGIVLFKKGDIGPAVELFQRLVACNPSNARNQKLRDASVRFQDENSIIIDQCRQLLRKNPDHVEALNNLAWLYATCPDNAVRNGTEAVKLAKRACELTNYKVTICVGTLGAAYAETKQFDQAIATARQACQLAEQGGDENLLKKNRMMLELFESGSTDMEVPPYIFEALTSR